MEAENYEKSAVRVAIVEDQEATRDGLALLLEGAAGIAAVGAWPSFEEAWPRLPAARPDVVLLDLGLPGLSGIEGARRLATLTPRPEILVLTVFGDDDHVFEAICAGASGYLLKDTPPEKLLAAIAEVASGGVPMSPEVARKVFATFQKIAPPRQAEQRLSTRELEVLQLFADGHSYKTAAKALAVSIDTVRFHIRNIYEKLHVHSKSEAVVKALREGLL